MEVERNQQTMLLEAESPGRLLVFVGSCPTLTTRTVVSVALVRRGQLSVRAKARRNRCRARFEPAICIVPAVID